MEKVVRIAEWVEKRIGTTLVRVDWQTDEEEMFAESTTLENLPQMLASIQQQGGRVIGVRTLEKMEESGEENPGRSRPRLISL